MPGAGDSVIPGGFTYLGQFVDHDITFDRTEGIPDGSLDPAEILQGRSPALELDSVYGRGPAKSPELYESDGRRLKIGTTTGRATFGVTQAFPNDLPRQPAGRPGDPELEAGNHRRPTERRESDRGPDPPRLPQVPQQGGGAPAGLRHGGRPALRGSPQDGRPALPVHRAPRLRAPADQSPSGRRRHEEGPEGLRPQGARAQELVFACPSSSR